jgi:hypothetical protein
MRTPALIVGILLLIVGGLISAGVFSFTKQSTVAKLGPLEITASEQKKPAPVLGYVLLGAGVLVLAFGAASKK